MGKPLMIQEEDERRIEMLKRRLKILRKVDIVRAGIELLEKEADRKKEPSAGNGLRPLPPKPAGR